MFKQLKDWWQEKQFKFDKNLYQATRKPTKAPALSMFTPLNDTIDFMSATGRKTKNFISQKGKQVIDGLLSCITVEEENVKDNTGALFNGQEKQQEGETYDIERIFMAKVLGKFLVPTGEQDKQQGIALSMPIAQSTDFSTPVYTKINAMFDFFLRLTKE